MDFHRQTVRYRSRGALGLAAAGVVLAAAACGGTTGKPSPSGSSSQAAQNAKAAVAEARMRDRAAPQLPPNPAVKGRKLAVVSFNMANESGSVPADAAKEAAQAIGWQVEVYDAKGSVGSVTGLVRQASAAGAQAIIAVDIDCAAAAQAFGEAKRAGIIIVPVNGFDCDDAGSPAGRGPSAFSGAIKPGGGVDQDQFWMQDGSDVAQAAIADSGNTAKIISVESDGLGVEYWQAQGFNATVSASGGSQVVEHVKFTTADFVSGRLTTMIEAALTRHPEATYIKSAFSAATVANVVPAVRASHSSIKLLGGEGLQPELDLVRNGQMLATDTTPGAWQGWAAVDTANSLFRGAAPNDSGLQWVLVEKTDVPANGSVQTADYMAAYRASWGVS